MGNALPKILVVDDNEDILLAAKLLLKPHASFIATTKDPAQINSLLNENTLKE